MTRRRLDIIRLLSDGSGGVKRLVSDGKASTDLQVTVSIDL